ncbi:MAG: hypothetical protein AcusKO_24460 [Acuticoccus sp.]
MLSELGALRDGNAYSLLSSGRINAASMLGSASGTGSAGNYWSILTASGDFGRTRAWSINYRSSQTPTNGPQAAAAYAEVIETGGAATFNTAASSGTNTTTEVTASVANDTTETVVESNGGLLEQIIEDAGGILGGL